MSLNVAIDLSECVVIHGRALLVRNVDCGDCVCEG